MPIRRSRKPGLMGTLAIAALLLGGCSAPHRAPARTGTVPAAERKAGHSRPARAWTQTGIASWYGGKFHGRRTASGERFNKHALTAAHRELPFGTLVRVISLRTGRHTVVRINDRGPFVKGRVIDLSHAAARQLGIVASGVDRVRLEIVGRARG